MGYADGRRIFHPRYLLHIWMIEGSLDLHVPNNTGSPSQGNGFLCADKSFGGSVTSLRTAGGLKTGSGSFLTAQYARPTSPGHRGNTAALCLRLLHAPAQRLPLDASANSLIPAVT